MGNCGWESGRKSCGTRCNAVASCVSCLKHGPWGLAPLLDWPTFCGSGAVFVEAVPPTASARVSRT